MFINAEIQRSLASVVFLPLTAAYKFDLEKIDLSAVKRVALDCALTQ